jgi:hypothetical protein
MNKLKLQAENLQVVSFDTIADPTETRGTVRDPGGCICFAPPCICTAGPDCTQPTP